MGTRAEPPPKSGFPLTAAQPAFGSLTENFPAAPACCLIINGSPAPCLHGTPEDLVKLDDFQNIFSLKGQVAVISGGSRGLGLHTASGFLQAGCSRVYIVARNEGPLNDAAKVLNALPNKGPDARAVAIVADISSQAGCTQMAAEISKTTDHVDILVANAGATFIGHMDDYKEDDFDRVMKINVSSIFFSAQKLSPLLQAGGTVQDPSRIIMVSSVAGVVVGDMAYAYAASKAAVIHLMKNLAVEPGPKHITVNVVAPGMVPSQMSAPLMNRHGGIESVAKQVPEQKLGSPEDVAGVMVFLSSRASKHIINGATIVLDGGSYLIAGAVVNSAAINLGMYIAGRVLMGNGISMELTIAPTLLQEIAHPRYRAQIGSMYTCIYYISAVESAGVCLGTRHIEGKAAWRIPCYLQLVGPGVTLVMIFTMPESPRWLVRHGASDEALQIPGKYHANGDINDPLVRLEYEEIMENLRVDEVNSETKYTDYFLPNNRPRLFLLVVIAIGTDWVGNGIISYYLSPILSTIDIRSTEQQAGLNLGLQIWNLILSTSAALSVDRVGRRPHVYKYAETCIQSCRNYIETALQVLTKRTPYVWAICQA
ncbi:Rhamnolipids biosynthesis 3-oxoacyl-[acyl-carrier-protein] reductase [Colletotrichum aenigma]|uniref:Rhamnolipids biosynthesis 3-oxoacyl-[acyl-carrier-protein] reductase n=1 Tax=Colletotrichum aenigma TaxID=1215731 RepID=UPI00187216B6|nr:Rhamnolipids biosynthesis 3-oxoacyl-[acyl-carrier-protein] reductase [Colletotrichum aenigma]KAF5502078.1 Rhamnolipids biosynthesis 3-oxoacyl-[acyl-carrier-protein] reductase [Colletotrichum aenigma]